MPSNPGGISHWEHVDVEAVLRGGVPDSFDMHTIQLGPSPLAKNLKSPIANCEATFPTLHHLEAQYHFHRVFDETSSNESAWIIFVSETLTVLL